jgi:serine protease Do
MRGLAALLVLTATWITPVWAQSSRLIIDDDAYADNIVHTAHKLLREHKLVSLESLRAQVHTEGVALRLQSLSREKLEPPELCERLRESTLAVGTFYKCPDCGEWHFSSSTGFVVGESGIVCTCCHVILEEDEQVREGYLVAADAAGHVYPVQAVLAADTDADTCLIRIGATGLKPLALRAGVRQGEPVYCLSHPGGYYFMFTQGLVARLNRRTNADAAANGHSDSPSRPILLLNITAEFAPGSSGAPVVDPWGNVVGQVDSIADAGEAASDEENQTTSPSVPIRFCTATEEILRLTSPSLAKESHSPRLKPAAGPKKKLRPLTIQYRCPKTMAPGGAGVSPAAGGPSVVSHK